jgi:heat shock protein HtpX
VAKTVGCNRIIKMPSEIFSYNIETEIPSNYLVSLLDFITQKYILPQGKRFANVSKTARDGLPSIVFSVNDLEGRRVLNVEIEAGKPIIKVMIEKIDERLPEEGVSQIKEDIIIAIELFEERIRKSTLYFAWREGEEIIPEVHRKEKPINRIFLETQIFLSIGFLIFSLVLFSFLGWLTPIVLIGIQFIFVFYSSKIIAKSADWQITESNPRIHLLMYHLPQEEHDRLGQEFSREKMMEIKKEIYAETLSKKGQIDCDIAQKIFARHGFKCIPENLSTKIVNVYELVKKIAEKFGFPTPQIVVSNTMIPNAAASGPSPSRGVVLITTGLLVQLEEDEISSVLGHEFGHLKGRDPLLIYGLTATEFLIRFYLIFPLFPYIFYSLNFFLYFWAVMTIIYFVSKFFEARADLISAMVMGQPEVLAEALEKIGFRRLMYERIPSNRVQEWISLEPHPPIYFRANRLEKLDASARVNHPFLQSVKDVTKGFLVSIGLYK